MDLTDIYRLFYLITVAYPGAHGTLSMLGHILGHKASLNKYKTLKQFLISYQILVE
jgi:hypothetical protein